MESGDNGLERLVEVIQLDTQARTRELAALNEQLEQRNQLLEQQLNKKTAASKVFALLAGLAALVVAGWVYLLILQLGNNLDDMSARMGSMQVYMKNMGEGEPVEGERGYMSSMAHNINGMTGDIGAMREAIDQVSSDIGVMRVAMTEMRGDISLMNTSMSDMGSATKSMRDNIDGMAKSVGHMNRSVGRLSRDAQTLGDPFRGMMPW